MLYVDNHDEQNGQMHVGCVYDDQLQYCCQLSIILQHTQVVDTVGSDKLFFNFWAEINCGITIQEFYHSF